MKVSYVSFGQHVKSVTAMRLGERYIGLGVCQSMEYKDGLLMVEVMGDKLELLAIPMSNVAFMVMGDKK